MKNKHSRRNESRILKHSDLRVQRQSFSRSASLVALAYSALELEYLPATCCTPISTRINSFAFSLLFFPVMFRLYDTDGNGVLDTNVSRTRKTSIFRFSSFLFLFLFLFLLLLSFPSITTDDNRFSSSLFDTRGENGNRVELELLCRGFERSILYLYFLLNERVGWHFYIAKALKI